MESNLFQGARLKKGNTEFVIYAPKAQKLELCIFSDNEDTETKIAMGKDKDGYWRAEINGNFEGKKYGYRAYGKYDPSNKMFFNPNKLLVDPYAHEITKSLYSLSEAEKEILTGDNDLNSANVAPKSVVRFLDKEILEKRFPFLYKKPHIPIGKTHIYELNVGNFSFENHRVSPKNRGKLRSISEEISYFKELHYNQIEFMPLTPTVAGKHLLQDLGLSDQWGYNPICHQAIDPRYGNIYDFLAIINDLHANGIEVCMDVVFNHTGEFDRDLFLLSYKGLDAESYYRFAGPDFVNTTGCHNGFNTNSEQSGRVISDSLMFFADVAGVDAFRFDLAGDCALDNNLQFDPNGRFMSIVREVSRKTGAKMSGEPWSATGGYFLGQMPDILEWNDKHEKTLRKFIRGDFGQVGNLAYYMSGGGVDNKINIFTKHDGTTQYDWATYHKKNNYENNENNNDGSDDNCYSPSIDNEQKLVKTKTAHALNTLARGVPLSLSGDEIWHSQNGNNNGYAKRFPLRWNNLTPEQKERYIFERKVNAFRLEHPAFSCAEHVKDEIMPNGKPSWAWININGDTMQQNDWDFYYNRFLSYVINGQNKKGQRFDDDFLVMISGNDKDLTARLPEITNGMTWSVVFDTAEKSSHCDNNKYKMGDVYMIKPHSMVVMTCKRNIHKSNIREINVSKDKIR